MQREGSCVGPIVQQPLDALLILVFFTVRNSGKEVIYLHGEEKKPILQLQDSFFVKAISNFCFRSLEFGMAML